MDELIDIVDQNGKPTGKTALKSEAHKNGWYHNTIHLWLYTAQGEILLQQRSHKKAIHPLLWDVSVAGHIDAGETFKQAALRECEEEIGLKLSKKQLKKIGVFLHKSEYMNGAIKDYEFHQVFIAQFHGSLDLLTPQAEEVEALKLVNPESFLQLLSNSSTNSHFIESNKAYYQYILKKISKALNK